MDELRRWIRFQDGICKAFYQLCLIAPAQLALLFGMVLLNQGKQPGISWLPSLEFDTDKFWVRLKMGNVFIRKQCIQTALKIINLAQVAIALVEIRPQVCPPAHGNIWV
jgi:hypothetical protein